jgi:hypothetical protein
MDIKYFLNLTEFPKNINDPIIENERKEILKTFSENIHKNLST